MRTRNTIVARLFFICKISGRERDSDNGMEVAFHESMRIDNTAQASVLSPGLPDLVVDGPRNTIIWRPRCTDSPVLR